MGKRCTVTFEKISISAVQDLVAIKADAAKPIRILRYWFGVPDTTLPSQNMVALRARTATATVTLGSGGASATPVHLDATNTTTISATAHVNDTSKATTSGSFVIVDEQGVFIYSGYDSAQTGRDPIDIPAAGGFVLELISALGGATVCSGGVDFEELG